MSPHRTVEGRPTRLVVAALLLAVSSAATGCDRADEARGAAREGAQMDLVARSYVELDHEWPERRSVAIREPPTPPPIAHLLTRKPWLLPRLIAGDIPATRREPGP